MAKAEINKIIIETPVQVTVTEIKKEEKQTGVRLDLTMAEAEAVRAALGWILGDGKNSPRKYTERVWNALGDAGVTLELDHYVFEGRLTAKDYPSTKKAPPEPVNPLKGDPEVGAGFNGCKGPKAYKPEPAVTRAFKKGDLVEIIDNGKEAHFKYKVGTKVLVASVASDSIYDTEDVNIFKNRLRHAVEEAPVEPPQHSFQVGDVVRVITSDLHVIDAGDRAQITQLGFGGFYLTTTGCGPKKKGFAIPDQVELISTAGVLSNL